MRRSVQVGIAVLVLSVWLWNKLFFISDYLGGGSLNLDSSYLETEFLLKALLIFFLSYYTQIKVFQ